MYSVKFYTDTQYEEFKLSMRTNVFQSYNFSVMKLRQSNKKSVSGARKVTSMVKPLQSLHLRQFAEAQPVGAGPVRKVTEAQHEARAGVKSKC